MKLLAIDTSTELISVALAFGDDLISEEQLGVRAHAQLILPMIQQLLARAQLSLNQLDAIVFGRGPGSFTGLRIACSVAKGLAYAHDLPLFPVSSLAAIAHEAYQKRAENPSNLAVLAMLDARMHQLYWGYFRAGEHEVFEQVTSASEVSVPISTPLLLAGVGLESYAPQLKEVIQSQMIQQDVIFPKASVMLQIVQHGQIQPVSALEALPVYVRQQVTQERKSNG